MISSSQLESGLQEPYLFLLMQGKNSVIFTPVCCVWNLHEHTFAMVKWQT